MRRMTLRMRVGAAVAAGLARAVVRRFRMGPTLPSWTWAEDLFVAAYRAGLTTAARDVEVMGPRGRGLQLPLRRDLRRRLAVATEDLGGVRAEQYRPLEERSGTILYFHGGGFVSGSPGLERQVAAERACTLRCETWNVSYRLAPRHPFPAAVDDGVTAYQSLLARGAEPATTILYGGSAGAGLALATLVKALDLGLPMPAGAVLLWPYADMTFSGPSVQTNSDVDVLDLQALAPVWGPAYVGDADPADPLVSPALADLTGLPPLLIIAGGAESLLSCAEQIATSGRAANVDVQLSIYPEKVHGWMLLPQLAATRQATAEIDDWVRSRLSSST
jgi:epsilon-lactone hydrolase